MIDKIREDGANQALRDAISRRLHKAREELEKSPYDDYKRFIERLAAARALIDEAEMCFRELPESSPKKKRP